MARKRFTAEQIIMKLREAEVTGSMNLLASGVGLTEVMDPSTCLKRKNPNSFSSDVTMTLPPKTGPS